MKQIYNVAGMTCSGCKATVQNALFGVDGVTSVEVDLEGGSATVTSDKVISTADLKSALPEKYKLSEKNIFGNASAEIVAEPEKSKIEQLKPLFLIFGFMFLTNILVQLNEWNTVDFMLNFMATFFFIFSFFKFLDIKGFASSFSMYDPIAKSLPFYGMIYPFIELILGIMFLIRFQVDIALIATIIILGVTTIGVTRVLLAKKTVQCACLGSVLNLPMTLATFIENAIMIVMALLMIMNWL